FNIKMGKVAFNVNNSLHVDLEYTRFRELVDRTLRQQHRYSYQEYLSIIRNAKKRVSAVGLGLPDVPEHSENILYCLRKRQMVSHSIAKTLTDLKLLLLSWVYYLNFKTSFTLLLRRDYINKIASTLPNAKGIKEAVASLNEFIAEKAKE
ncbi:MAG: hypothetical protein HY957_06560, partial [Nitrospirae bacterium]|nr:hypothetical protein [Nitrospirota bacterium]